MRSLCPAFLTEEELGEGMEAKVPGWGIGADVMMVDDSNDDVVELEKKELDSKKITSAQTKYRWSSEE